jgi:hypothetical protein
MLVEKSVYVRGAWLIANGRRGGNSGNIIQTGHAVAQLVEALRYNPEVRGFDSRR